MGWIMGGSVTFTGNAQQLTTSHIAMKEIRFTHDPGNSHNLYYGNSLLSSSASPKTGVLGWLPPPSSAAHLAFEWIEEYDSQNGIDAATIYVQGQANEILYWSYIVQ